MMDPFALIFHVYFFETMQNVSNIMNRKIVFLFMKGGNLTIYHTVGISEIYSVIILYMPRCDIEQRL